MTGDNRLEHLGPLILIRDPEHRPAQQHTLRDLVTRHDDTAWLNARPPTGKTTLAALSKDLLDASGIVGLSQPRTAGETHTLRVLPHWMHGPIRHLVISDAHDLQPASLEDVLDTAAVTGVTVWILSHGIAPKPDWTRWTSNRCAGRTHSLDWAITTWNRRNPVPGLCQVPSGSWWLEPDWWPSLTPCSRHANRTQCVLSWIRRGSGTPRPNAARELVISLLDHPATTVGDRWALCDASRDHYTPARDAVVQLGLYDSERYLEVRDVARDGSSITDRHAVGGPLTVAVPPQMRPAIARQRSAQLWAGCSPRTFFLGINGEEAWMS